MLRSGTKTEVVLLRGGNYHWLFLRDILEIPLSHLAVTFHSPPSQIIRKLPPPHLQYPQTLVDDAGNKGSDVNRLNTTVAVPFIYLVSHNGHNIFLALHRHNIILLKLLA